MTRQQRTANAAHRFGRRAPRPPIALRLFRHARWADPEQFGHPPAARPAATATATRSRSSFEYPRAGSARASNRDSAGASGGGMATEALLAHVLVNKHNGPVPFQLLRQKSRRGPVPRPKRSSTAPSWSLLMRTAIAGIHPAHGGPVLADRMHCATAGRLNRDRTAFSAAAPFGLRGPVFNVVTRRVLAGYPTEVASIPEHPIGSCSPQSLNNH